MTTQHPILSVKPLPHGMCEVVDRLTGEVHQIKVNRGRHIGPCTCGGDQRPPWGRCPHQVAVRDYLTDRWLPHGFKQRRQLRS
jgi:hypothetical protein